MNKLSDGTVISSAFRRQPAQIGQGHEHVKRSESLKIGTIIAVRNVDASQGLQKSATNSSEGVEGTPYETVYDVRVDDHNSRPFIFNGCRALKPFMGANNYFEVIHEAADMSTTYIEKVPGSPIGGIYTAPAESLMGSRCVVLCIEGEPTAPVIVGFLQHPGRTSTITKDKGLHMEFEFNGFKCMIDKDGAFKLESNGPFIPTITAPIGPVPDGIIRMNPLAGPFTVEITKDMVFTLKDNTGQMISIDRTSNTMEFGNGGDFIRIVGSLIPGQGEMFVNAGKSMTVSSLDGTFGFDKSFSLNTLELKMDATTSTTIATGDMKVDAKLAIAMNATTEIKLAAKVGFSVEATTLSLKGKTGELLALVAELIEGLGMVTAASPVGPCAPIQAAPQWAQVQAALLKLKGMTG